MEEGVFWGLRRVVGELEGWWRWLGRWWVVGGGGGLVEVEVEGCGSWRVGGGGGGLVEG